MHTPGSSAAQEAGCKCPREPNQDGRGTFSIGQMSTHTHFLIDQDCPLHGKDAWRES